MLGDLYMQIIIIVVIIALLGKVIGALIQGSQRRQARIRQQIGIEGKKITSYLREAEKATSVSSFLSTWSNIEYTKNRLLHHLKEQVRDRDVKRVIDETCRTIDGMGNDYQRMICAAIERKRKSVVKEMKTTYKYSPEMRESLYTEFKDDISKGYSTYTDDTKRIADSVLREVGVAAGSLELPSKGIALPSGADSKSTTGIIFDNMEGHQFEYFCADLLTKNGFENVQVTQGSGDQGVDILAEKDDIRYAIQCKSYKGELSNKPIQEVYAGKKIYRCQVAAVLTNSFFTEGAKEAARATGVLLWDRNRLQRFIKNAQEQGL